MEPLVSIVLPTYNRAQVVGEVLQRLDPGRLTVPTETIVVDNASSDGTVDHVRREFPWVRLFPQTSNRGAAGRNVGIEHAAGRYLLMLDDDSYPLGQALEHGVQLLEQDEPQRIGCVAYRVRQLDGSYDAAGIHTSYVGCGALFRTAQLRAIGGYPEGYLFYVEEYDVACRLWGQGLRVHATANAEVLHLKSLINRDTGVIVRQLVRNNLLLWTKFLPPDLARQQVAAELWRYRHIALRSGVLPSFELGLEQGEVLREHWEHRREHELPRAAAERVLGLDRVRKVAADLKQRGPGRRVLLWSVGKQLHWLIDELRRQGLEPVGVVDTNPAMQGQSYAGIPVFGPDRFTRGGFDVVQLSTTSLALTDALCASPLARSLAKPLFRLCDYAEEPVLRDGSHTAAAISTSLPC